MCMPTRKPTEAAVRKQLKSVDAKIAGTTDREKRLELLRQQAHLGDQRDAAFAARVHDHAETSR